MGHYYADLMCDTCGHITCICPRKPKPVEYVVTRVFQVKRADKVFYYPDTPRFQSKQAAEEAVPECIRKRINELQAEIDMLNTMLDLKSDKFCEKCGAVKTSCFCDGGYL